MKIEDANELLESVLGEAINASSTVRNPYAKIANMTHENDHNGAILEGAKLLGLKHLEDRIKLVVQLHKLEGHMPSGLAEYQYQLNKELMNAAKQKLSAGAYEQFSKAY